MQAEEIALLLRPLDSLSGGVEARIAKTLLAHLSKYPATKHITIQTVRQITPGAELGQLNSNILKTLQFLAGDAVKILEPRFELIEPDEDPIALDESQLSSILEHGVNPFTGEHSPDIKKHVYLFFQPVQNIVGLLRYSGDVISKGQIDNA